ncbi:MAG: hypothetical protein ABWY45_04235 [Mycobacterium sp.]
MAADPNTESGDYEQRVDPGALALATVAGAVAFIFGGGDWDALACVVGSMLIVILMAHHRAAPTTRSPRAYFLRAAFGATTGLAICIAIAPAIQFGVVEPYFPTFDEDGYLVDGAYHTTVVISVLWVFVAALLAVAEPRIARWLDRPARRERTGSGPDEL